MVTWLYVPLMNPFEDETVNRFTAKKQKSFKGRPELTLGKLKKDYFPFLEGAMTD